MESHPRVEKVFYPGLKSHEHYPIARKQMTGFGGLLSFVVKGGSESVKSFLSRLRCAHLAANLGAVEAVAGPPAATSHVEITQEERAAASIPEALIRYSVGIEDAEDLIDDLQQGLDAMRSAERRAQEFDSTIQRERARRLARLGGIAPRTPLRG